MQSGIQMKEQGAAPPPYSGYPPSQPAVASQPVVVGAAVAYPAAAVVPTVVPAVVVGNPMGTSPTIYICKSCNNQIITKVERRPSMRTHLFALLLCVFGCWPCVCLPYCIDSCNNADHYCPHCNSYIGSYIG